MALSPGEAHGQVLRPGVCEVWEGSAMTTPVVDTNELVDLWAQEQNDEIHMIWTCFKCGPLVIPGKPELFMGACGVPTLCVMHPANCKTCLRMPSPKWCARCGGPA